MIQPVCVRFAKVFVTRQDEKGSEIFDRHRGNFRFPFTKVVRCRNNNRLKYYDQLLVSISLCQLSVQSKRAVVTKRSKDTICLAFLATKVLLFWIRMICERFSLIAVGLQGYWLSWLISLVKSNFLDCSFSFADYCCVRSTLT